MASNSQKYEWDYKNNVKHHEKFEFPQLKGKTGLFIIEFVGNGKTARAVIKKGRLSLVHRETTSGHLCYLLDHNNNICKGDLKTGIIFQKKFYEADKVSGSIYIPYADKKVTKDCILVQGEFAQLTRFTQKKEEYYLWASFFMNDQAAMLGKTA